MIGQQGQLYSHGVVSQTPSVFSVDLCPGVDGHYMFTVHMGEGAAESSSVHSSVYWDLRYPSGSVLSGGYNSTFFMSYSSSSGEWQLMYKLNDITEPPSCPPTGFPSLSPSARPTEFGETNSPSVSMFPTKSPSSAPSSRPTRLPTTSPSVVPSAAPSVNASCVSVHLRKNCGASDWSGAVFSMIGQQGQLYSHGVVSQTPSVFSVDLCPGVDGHYMFTVHMGEGAAESSSVHSSVYWDLRYPSGSVLSGGYNSTFFMSYSSSSGEWQLMYKLNDITEPPSCPPTGFPSLSPSARPTEFGETNSPSVSMFPTKSPSSAPSSRPTRLPTTSPSSRPTILGETNYPSSRPTTSRAPSSRPTVIGESNPPSRIPSLGFEISSVKPSIVGETNVPSPRPSVDGETNMPTFSVGCLDVALTKVCDDNWYGAVLFWEGGNISNVYEPALEYHASVTYKLCPSHDSTGLYWLSLKFPDRKSVV